MTRIKTGEIITAYCSRKRVIKSALARKIGIDYQVLLKNLKSNNLRIDTLLKICDGLGHNFLMDMALQLPENYTSASK